MSKHPKLQKPYWQLPCCVCSMSLLPRESSPEDDRRDNGNNKHEKYDEAYDDDDYNHRQAPDVFSTTSSSSCCANSARGERRNSYSNSSRGGKRKSTTGYEASYSSSTSSSSSSSSSSSFLYSSGRDQGGVMQGTFSPSLISSFHSLTAGERQVVKDVDRLRAPSEVMGKEGKTSVEGTASATIAVASSNIKVSGAGLDTSVTMGQDQERQLLLLMLLAQVCSLHDATPRTFTVHVLSLFERGILDRESIHFLFDLGLVPRNQVTAEGGGGGERMLNKDDDGYMVGEEDEKNCGMVGNLSPPSVDFVSSECDGDGAIIPYEPPNDLVAEAMRKNFQADARGKGEGLSESGHRGICGSSSAGKKIMISTRHVSEESCENVDVKSSVSALAVTATAVDTHMEHRMRHNHAGDLIRTGVAMPVHPPPQLTSPVEESSEVRSSSAVVAREIILRSKERQVQDRRAREASALEIRRQLERHESLDAVGAASSSSSLVKTAFARGKMSHGEHHRKRRYPQTDGHMLGEVKAETRAIDINGPTVTSAGGFLDGSGAGAPSSDSFVSPVAKPAPAVTATGAPSTSWAVEHHPLSLSRYQREFNEIRLLASGSFGEVYHAANKLDGRDYAVKRVTFSATGFSNDTVQLVMREVRCLAQCDHPNCVRYYTSWLEPSWMTGSGLPVTADRIASKATQRRLLTDIHRMVLSQEEGRSSTSSSSKSAFEQVTTSIAWDYPDHDLPMGMMESNDGRVGPAWFSSSRDCFRKRACAGAGNKNKRGGQWGVAYLHDDGSRGRGVRLENKSMDFSDLRDMGDSDYSDWSEGDKRGGGGNDRLLSYGHERIRGQSVELGSASSYSCGFDFNESTGGSRVGTMSDDIGTRSRRPIPASSTAAASTRQRKPPKENAHGSRYKYYICLFIQMELCHSSTLADWIRERNASTIQGENNDHERAVKILDIFKQIVRGLAHVHGKGIIHRDLKPANIFASSEDGTFKIGDFGLSKLLMHRSDGGGTVESRGSPRLRQCSLLACNDAGLRHEYLSSSDCDTAHTMGVGTASYAAPEQLGTDAYGPEADVFSLGLILLELLSNFGTEHERAQAFHDVRNYAKVPPAVRRVCPAMADIVLECTRSDIANRPTARDLLERDLLRESNSELNLAQLHGLRLELERKDKELQDQRVKLIEKDKTIEQLRRQLRSSSRK